MTQNFCDENDKVLAASGIVEYSGKPHRHADNRSD